MATFKTSAIIELIDKTKKGATSAIRNFGRMEKAADGFSDEVDKSTKNARISFKQFTFEQEKARRKLNDLRSDLRSGKGDFRAIEREIDGVTDSLSKLNRENRGLRATGALRRGLRGVGRGLLRAGVVGAGGAIVGGAAGINALAQQADDALKLAENTGFAVESVTALQFALSQTVTAEAVNALPAILRDLNARRGEFLRTGAGEVSSLDDGLKTILASAENTEDAFVKLGKEIRSRNLDTGELANTLEKLFGEPGRQLVPFFQRSGDEIEQLIKRADELGVVISQDVAQSAVDFNDNLDQAKQSVRGLAIAALGQSFQPLSDALENSIVPAIVRFTDNVKNINPSDIRDAFADIAELVTDTAEGLLNILGVASKIVDLATTTDREIRTEQIDDAARSARSRRIRREQGFFFNPFASEEISDADRLVAIQQLGFSPNQLEEGDRDLLLAEQRRQTELIQQLVNQGVLPAFGTPNAEGARQPSVTQTGNNRPIGTRGDSGQERVGIQ